MLVAYVDKQMGHPTIVPPLGDLLWQYEQGVLIVVLSSLRNLTS